MACLQLKVSLLLPDPRICSSLHDSTPSSETCVFLRVDGFCTFILLLITFIFNINDTALVRHLNVLSCVGLCMFV